MHRVIENPEPVGAVSPTGFSLGARRPETRVVGGYWLAIAGSFALLVRRLLVRKPVDLCSVA
jgi:hypothetical protein